MAEKNPTKKKMNGWLALSPLAVFLITYLVTSIVCRDFYKVPVSSAFVLASIYAMLITKGPVNERIGVFSSGAGDRNVLLMIWIFVLAGAFASVAKSIGSVEATVNLTLRILPGKFILAGLFLAACFISMSIGTSVGTIVALVPIASGIASQADISLPLITALIVGGAFFGDNLSFISDTTIAATTTQGCSMADKFKANIWIAGPAALIVTVLYIVIGFNLNITPEIESIDPLKLIPYLSVIILAICGVNVLVVLTIGLFLCAVIGLTDGLTWTGFLGSVGDGIAGMGDLIIVTMLAGGMLELIRHNGGIEFIINGLTKGIKGKRGAEFSIAGLVGLSNICTANNTIAILTTGNIAKDISERFKVDPRKSASILDTFSCAVQGLLPYGAQLLMVSGFTGISATQIIPNLFYPFVLLGVACISILLRLPRRFS
jgi:Na+/H+ antiporter NhaC